MALAKDLNDPDSSGIVNPIVREAHKRWRRCNEWESNARNNAMEDYKFDNGDVYNGYQWPAQVVEMRGEKPNLTVNEVHNHNNHLVNDALQNKSEVKFRPT